MSPVRVMFEQDLARMCSAFEQMELLNMTVLPVAYAQLSFDRGLRGFEGLCTSDARERNAAPIVAKPAASASWSSFARCESVLK